jgi:hypothetical protein
MTKGFKAGGKRMRQLGQRERHIGKGKKMNDLDFILNK